MNDNPGMDTFDDIEVSRPTLAESYLGLLAAQPGRPLALFAPRRVGKTYFLDHDLAPAAKRVGLVPVYADVWLHKAAPLVAINHALEEAIDDLTVPSGPLGRLAKTPVTKLGVLGTSLEIGSPPERRPLPNEPELRLDALAARLAEKSGQQVLLMLDEIQSLGDLLNGEAAIATLRAVLQKRKRQIMAVFTGSSQDALAAMMTAVGGPMYQFAQIIDFPVLGVEYLERLADHFERVHRGTKLSVPDLQRVFGQIGCKPALMKDLVKAMSAEGSADVDLGLKRFMQDDRQLAGWRALLLSLQPFERAVLVMIAQGHPPLGRETLARLREVQGFSATVAKVRVSLDKLKKAGVLARPLVGGYTIEDRLLAQYLADLELKKVV
jgi:hypothetical protein